MKVEFSANDKVTIYPNKKGLEKMVKLLQENDCMSRIEATEKVAHNIIENDGYSDQLWCIIQDFGSMFFNGQNYFEKTTIRIES